MWGARGGRLRRRLILPEFVIGDAGSLGLGVVLLASNGGLGGTLLGVWLVGLGANYLPLAAYAIVFSAPGALESELSGVDTAAELRYYSLRQGWVVVPLLLLGLAIVQRSAPGQR